MSKTPVSTLQEYMAKRSRPTPIYEIIATEGSGTHQPSFTYRVTCGDEYATGTASNKKDAKHIAAREFLRQLSGFDHKNSLPSANGTVLLIENPQTNSYFEPGSDGSNIFVNTVGKLGEHCLNFKLNPPIYEEGNVCGPAHQRMYTIICSVGDTTVQATAFTKKQAKHDVARKMLQTLMNTSTTDNGHHENKQINNCDHEVQRELRGSFNLLYQKTEQPKIPVDQKIEQPKISVDQKIEQPKIPANQKIEQPKILVDQKIEQPKIPVNQKIEQPKIPVKVSIELAKQMYLKLQQQNHVKVKSNLSVKAHSRDLKKSQDPTIQEKIRRQFAAMSSCTKQEELDRISKLFDAKVECVTLATTDLGSAVRCKLDSFPMLEGIGIGVTFSEAREKASDNLLNKINALHM